MIKPLSEIHPTYNFLMGYYVGVQKKWWYGIEGITFIFMGSWNDPLIGYNGWAVNVFEIEDPMWDVYNEECPAPKNYSSAEYREYENKFEDFMRENKNSIFSMLDDVIAAETAEMARTALTA